MKSFLLVFFGGGIGSGLRYLLSDIIGKYSKVFPIGTFTVNMLGCLLIGLVIGYVQEEDALNTNQSLLLATGFCGGFTTFSAFANENLELIKNGELLHFFIYTAGSIFISLISVFIGFYIAKLIN